MREPQREGQPDQRVHLVHVAEHRERVVEQVLEGVVQRRLQRSGAGDGQAEHPTSRLSGSGRRSGIDRRTSPRSPRAATTPVERDQERGGGEVVGAGPPGAAADEVVGDPVVGAAHGVGPAQRAHHGVEVSM